MEANQMQELFRQIIAEVETSTEEESVDGNELFHKMQDMPEEAGVVYDMLRECIAGNKVRATVWLYSFLIRWQNDVDLLEEFIGYVTESGKLTIKEKYFLYYQVTRLIFMNPLLETRETVLAKWKLLEKVFEEMKQTVSFQWKRIPAEERNPKMAVVITEQFLGVEHGPTKTALDRCAALKKMGKKVLLINTAEFFCVDGKIPFVETKVGNYQPEKSLEEKQIWKGETIPFFQCDNTMPDVKVVELLLNTIYSLKPDIVVNIGGASIVAGLVNELVPVLTVGTTQSGVTITMTDYQVMHGELDENGKWILEKMGRTAHHIIPGRFTFALKDQAEFVTREEVGLPEEQFLLFVIGGRLEQEVTEEFIRALERVAGKEIGVVFIGPFPKFDEYAKKYDYLNHYAYNLGACMDILSRIELCDLYVNPTRKGGGTSAVEAMYKGKPAVSVGYGDVAGIIGEEFCCADYDEMVEIIKRYSADKQFYQEQSERAYKLAEEYLDTDGEFKRILSEYQKKKA